MKIKSRILIVVPVLLAVLIPSASLAVVDMFLKIDGVKGESQDQTYKEQIDVLAWSWGLSNSSTMHLGGGGGAGKANFQDLSITKFIDVSSPELMLAVSTGKIYKTAELILRKPGGDKPVDYYKIMMTDVIVTSLSTGGSGGEDRLTENITLNFATVKVEYIPQQKDGSNGTLAEFGFDIAQNIQL